MEIPKKPETPVYQEKHGERQGENRSRLGWKIYCTKCGHIQGTTNYELSRQSALDRLEKQHKLCPDCGEFAWDSAEITD